MIGSQLSGVLKVMAPPAMLTSAECTTPTSRVATSAIARVGLRRKFMRAPVVQAGWVVYSVDYRPSERIAIEPIEFDDTVEAVKTVRKFPFIDPSRVGLMGG